MRNAFASELTQIAAEDKRVVLLSGDIGNRLFDKFKEIAPDRFFNCGIAESNMIGVGAGLAMSGLRPVAYTIAPFVTTRCLEQIKIDVCYHNVPVIIVGTGSGLSYASLGPTHHCCEDIAILRVMPNMTIVCPGDTAEVRFALRKAFEVNGPVYIRLGKKGEPNVHSHLDNFEIGKGIVVRDGRDVCLLSTGNTLPVATEVAEKLALLGRSAKVVSLHTVKPLDESLLSANVATMSLVATIEEHSIVGGLGGAVAEWYARQVRPRARLLSFGVGDTFLHESGNQKYARQQFALTADQLVPRIMHALAEEGKVLV
jgi:transketolase